MTRPADRGERPEVFGVFGAAGRILVEESHVSVLLFAGERVYKFRKPVRFGFVDFRSREVRELDCRREVELNSRFAPDVYLGVVDISSEGELLDHAVVMRRMPSERRLSALAAHGEVGAEIRAVARVLAEVEQYALRSPEIDAAAERDAVLSGWRSNFDEVARFVGPILDPETEGRIQVLAERFLAGRGELFRQRIAEGAVRDGHGDLQADDIYCLEDGPRILDCIEFDDRLRYGDVASDLAFLVMDLERLRRRDLGAALLANFEEFVGSALPRPLVQHYAASRAYVRALVACLSAEEGLPGAAERARGLQRLALSFLERSRIRLVVVGGLPGTGKSTLAAGLADALGMVVLRSDEVRQEVAPAGDRYGARGTAATYAALFDRARTALELGQSVVLDASFIEPSHRSAARRLAVATVSDLVELECRAPQSTALRRIAVRHRQGGDVSEATVEVARAMAKVSAPWPEAYVIDTAGRRSAALAAARRLVA